MLSNYGSITFPLQSAYLLALSLRCGILDTGQKESDHKKKEERYILNMFTAVKTATATVIVGGAILIGGATASANADPNSIVDYLYYSEEDHSMEARAVIAKEFDIKNYKGTAPQNIELLSILKEESDYEYNPQKEDKVVSEEPVKEEKAEPVVEEKAEPVKEEKAEPVVEETPKATGNTQTFEVTYYTAFCDTGCTGVTATGLDVSGSTTHNGHGVVAVDPSVIPLGSIVEIDGSTYSAQDTGGNIKGNRLDILVGSKSEASSNGRHSAQVRVIK